MNVRIQPIHQAENEDILHQPFQLTAIAHEDN